MSRSSRTGIGRVELLGVLLAATASLLLPAASAGADEVGLEDNPPVISGGAVSPSSLPNTGGNVQLSAEVSDDFGLMMVYAQVYLPDGSTQSIQLFQGNETTYFGTLEVPPNGSESPVEYGVEVQVWDTNGAYSASLIGGVQVEATPQFDEPPYATEAQLTPSLLPAEGGTFTISAQAGDNRSLTGLFATVSTLNGSLEVPLQQVSPGRFEGSYALPANPGPAPLEYVVEVVAQDDVGQEGRASAGIVTVEAPPVPAGGQLAIWPGDPSFGSVRLGKRVRRLVFLRNTGPRRSAPVSGVARISGSSAFSLPGAPQGARFRLRPGAVKALLVEFRPDQVGPQAGALTIVRDDGAQSGLEVALAGEGAAPARHGPFRH